MEPSPNPPATPDVPALLQTARECLDRADLAGAFVPLQSVLEYDASQRTAWFGISELCYGAEQWKSAERACSYALSQYPRDRRARLMRARVRHLQREFDSALDDLEWLLAERLVPANDEELVWLRSDILYGQARYQWALDDINEVVIRSPHNEAARRWRDEMMRRLLACSQDAEELLAQVSALEARAEAERENRPTDDLPPLNPLFAGEERPGLLVRLALSYENAGRESDADEVVSALREEFDADPYVCVQIAEMAFRRRKLDEARYWVNRSIGLSPFYGGSHFLLGQIEAEIARRGRNSWLEERVLQSQLLAARHEYRRALEWMQGEWRTYFSGLGEVDFLKILGENARPQDAEWDAPPTGTDWDGVVEGFKAQDEEQGEDL